MTSATPDLRLPSQPHIVTTHHQILLLSDRDILQWREQLVWSRYVSRAPSDSQTIIPQPLDVLRNAYASCSKNLMKKISTITKR